VSAERQVACPWCQDCFATTVALNHFCLPHT